MVETVDQTAPDGGYVSLALDARGRPHISYRGWRDLSIASKASTDWKTR